MCSRIYYILKHTTHGDILDSKLDQLNHQGLGNPLDSRFTMVTCYSVFFVELKRRTVLLFPLCNNSGFSLSLCQLLIKVGEISLIY